MCIVQDQNFSNEAISSWDNLILNPWDLLKRQNPSAYNGIISFHMNSNQMEKIPGLGYVWIMYATVDIH